MKRVDETVETVQELGRDIGNYIREQRNSAEMSLRQLASLAGVSNPYLSQVERGLRNPSARILQQIAKALRISAEVLYVQAGILDQAIGGPVVDAVVADTHLSERQKQVLLDIYESFRRDRSAQAQLTEIHTSEIHTNVDNAPVIVIEHQVTGPQMMGAQSGKE
ncbi:MAG: helix-turn-helix domain-containing protein [Pseudonocardiales bacterium]